MNGWKIATFALAGLVVAQFLWWNKKAPEVLGLSGLGAARPSRRCKYVTVRGQRRKICWDKHGIASNVPA